MKSGNFDPLLSKYVGTLVRRTPSTKRKDFDRVTWGQKDSTQLSQAGCGQPTPTSAAVIRRQKSRLSDISLQWMLEEILALAILSSSGR